MTSAGDKASHSGMPYRGGPFQSLDILAAREDVSATTTLDPTSGFEENLLFKSLENTREPSLDPRISLREELRPTEEEIDETLTHRFGHLIFGGGHEKNSRAEKGEKEDEPIYVSADAVNF